MSAQAPPARVLRFNEAVKPYLGAIVDTDGVPVPGQDAVHRYLLVESCVRGNGYWLSTWPSEWEARDYSAEQEYADDWTVVAVVDLDAAAPLGSGYLT